MFGSSLGTAALLAMGTAGLVRLSFLSIYGMFYLNCTKKLLDRIKPEISPYGQSNALLGNWHVTALFWKPQIAILVSERILLPLLMPLAPASSLSGVSLPNWRSSKSQKSVDVCRLRGG